MPIELKQNPDGPIRVTTSLGADVLVLESFEGREAVSEPFEFTLHCLSLDASVDLASLLHTTACVQMQLPDGSDRYIHGHIRRAIQGAKTQDGIVHYTLEIVPRFWIMTLTSDCRIFQNKTVIEIIEQIFSERNLPNYAIRTTGSFEKRIYCVQYRETDFNFISRLLEEEGIFYFFEHTNDKHTMVLANANSAFKNCPVQNTMQYMSSITQLTEEDQLIEVWRGQQVHTGTITRTDYDFEKPTTSLMTDIEGQYSGGEE
jgi:type VI secretion system secreted protein VgrG